MGRSRPRSKEREPQSSRAGVSVFRFAREGCQVCPLVREFRFGRARKACPTDNGCAFETWGHSSSGVGLSHLYARVRRYPGSEQAFSFRIGQSAVSIKEILETYKTIAVVGLSAQTWRASYSVSRYMQ